MSSSFSVIKLGFTGEWKVLSHTLQMDPQLDVEEVTNATEAVTVISSVSGCLVLASLSKKEDLVQIASLMKSYKKVAPDTAIKIVVVNFSGERSYEKAIAKIGIQDIIDPGINAKALKFKVDFWMKGVAAQAKKNEAKLTNKPSLDASKAVDEKKTNDGAGLTWSPALDCVDDLWILKSEANCKRILGKWLIRIMGPSPYVAQWTEVNGSKSHWKFEFRPDSKESYLDGLGSWFFKGDHKPEFVWKENLWMITGSIIDLYYQDADQVYSRISLKNKNLTISKNSDYAKTKEYLIAESFDKELVLKNNGSINSVSEVDIEGGVEQLGNLAGKGKTEHQKNGPLSGKTNGTDELTSGLLAMDIDPNDNRIDDSGMSGPGSGPINKGKQLELESGQNEHKKHWKGHNEAEQFGDAGPLSGPGPEKARTGAELSLDSSQNEHKKHWKGHNEAEQFGDAGPLTGPGPDKVGQGAELALDGVDTAHKKHWKGHNSEAQAEAGDDSSPAGESLSGKLGGKSNVDKIETNYKGKEKSINDVGENKEGQGDVASLEVAKARKELEKVLEEESDPEFEQSCESAEVVSYLAQQNLKVACKFDDFFDQTVLFSTTKTGISASAEVEMDLSFKYLKKEAKLNLKGMVTEVDLDQEGTSYITVEIKDESVKSFTAFVKLYQIRQKNIDFFLKRVKGL